MASQRPLIIPWLIGKIGSPMYPGVEWVNDEKTKFRLPWKHGRSPDLSEDDYKIFKDWAIDSGLYDPTRHEPDPKRWKRNFRAALNQKDNIKLAGDYKSDSSDPHKVFEIKRDTEALYCDLKDFESAFVIPDAFAPVQEIDQHISSSQIPTEGAAAYYVEACAVGGDVPLGIISEVPAGQAQLVQQETFQEQILRHFTYNSFETDFEVNIFYRGAKVKSTTVNNRFGFCLTSRQEPSSSSYLEDVILPPPQDKVNNQLLVQAVNHILTNLDQGTLVEVREGAICGRRLGNCRSFWTITDTPTALLPSPIDKNDYSVLYTLQQFVTELIEFVERRRRDSPQYSIWICLGETWPDGKPWKSKCIMVQIIPVVMRLLHELSYGTGASSLSDSELNLEISDSLSSQSAVISVLRSIEEMMDWS